MGWEWERWERWERWELWEGLGEVGAVAEKLGGTRGGKRIKEREGGEIWWWWNWVVGRINLLR